MLQLKKTQERDYTKGNTKHKKYLAEKKEKKRKCLNINSKTSQTTFSCHV